MALVFIRVELQGNPSVDIYDRLHAYMEGQGWSRQITGTAGLSNLPHAMYQGEYSNEIEGLAEALKTYITAYIWTKPLVLCIQSTGNWTMIPANLA